MAKSYFRMQNISTGDIIHIGDVSVSEVKITKNMKWDSTPTLGRMDPIHNYQNTESIIDFVISTTELKTPANGRLYELEHSYTRQIRQTQDITEGRIVNMFNDTKSVGTNTEYVVNSLRSASLYNQTQFYKLFYPTYQNLEGSYNMKSAPVLKIKYWTAVGQNINEELGVVFEEYCILPSISVKITPVNFQAKQANINKIDLQISAQIIHTDPSLVSARAF